MGAFCSSADGCFFLFLNLFFMLILENTACTFASHRKQNLRLNTTELVLSAEYNGRTAQCNTKATGLRVSTFPRAELDLLIFLVFLAVSLH